MKGRQLQGKKRRWNGESQQSDGSIWSKMNPNPKTLMCTVTHEPTVRGEKEIPKSHNDFLQHKIDIQSNTSVGTVIPLFTSKP